MVYTVVSAVQDKLQEYSDAVKDEQDRCRREKEEEEKRKEEVRLYNAQVLTFAQAKLHGTIVTFESFEEWRIKFAKEMETIKSTSKDLQSTRLTGDLPYM